MLGNSARGHAKQHQRAGADVGDGYFDHHAACAVSQHFSRSGLAPISAIGRDRLRLCPHYVAPDAARETKAIAADTAQTGLIVIGRAKPAPGGGNHGVGIGKDHSTTP